MRGLFRKYVVLFVAVVGGALLASGGLELYFSYQENRDGLVELQREKALTAAVRIEQFVRGVERQIGWTTQFVVLPGTPVAAALEQRRFDLVRLQRQELAITEAAWVDAAGKEQLRVSRLAMDSLGSGLDRAREPWFIGARSSKVYFSPVYFRKESEPYLTIAMAAGSGAAAGVSVAEVNLKFIWDVVSQIKVGKAGYAYVVDDKGQLIAHPDISLVLQKRDLSGLPQVRGALAGTPTVSAEAAVATGLRGQSVLTAAAPVRPLGWSVLVEQPVAEAFAPVYRSAIRAAVLLAIGILLAFGASLILARRMVTPIRALQAGAARVGAGDLAHRIEVRTGDEIEVLAAQFNRAAEQLQESYANLEQKVEDRTSELRETLEQQTATSEILRVISSSPTDEQPVFDAIVDSARRLCDATFSVVFLKEGDHLVLAAAHGISEEGIAALHRAYPRPIARDTTSGRAILDRALVHIEDSWLDPEYTHPLRDTIALRSILTVPIFREGQPVGAISVWRGEVRPFSDAQIALLQTFADQAVIAIENVRLFRELEERNRAISETLEQQTATAEILNVISRSPTDIQPVLEAVARNASRLCEGASATLYRVEGSAMRKVAEDGPSLTTLEVGETRPITRETISGRVILERRTIHVEDYQSAEAIREYPDVRRNTGIRVTVGVPLLREGVAIGAFTVYRTELRAFSAREAALLQTFADQAVIAIENVRLFRELEERNRAVTEALEQQTATADILGVISGSPTDTQPVFDAIARSASALCDAAHSHVLRFDGERLHLAAFTASVRPEQQAMLEASYPAAPAGFADLAVREREVVHVVDALEDPRARRREFNEALGTRSLLLVPMVREGSVIGLISAMRTEVRPFTDRQIALLRTFADQAVIAIENVRLFTTLESRTQELARTVEQLEVLGQVGQVISSSLDLDVVLPQIVSHAVELSATDGGAIYEFDEAHGDFRLRATHGMERDLIEALRANPVRMGEGVVGRAGETREPVQIEDIASAGAYDGRMRTAMLASGFHALLAVPLLREGGIVGALVVRRRATGAFSPETVELLRTFATQSALAIQNARLFREIEDKSAQLEVANRHKSEFLANMSHELRTPLNAVIGFSEVLLDRMFGEVNDKQAEYLEDILSSGRHLLSLINDILDLSKIEAGRMELDLAPYDLPLALENSLTLVRERATRHGLRLELDVDVRLETLVGDERKVKQVLLNLLSNAVKFTPEGGRVSVRAALVDGHAEIAVADTGVGIAPEDHAAIFEEFRQVGTDYARKREGTGLGLALAKRFVELHGGAIRVESALGHGATFIVALPLRAAAVTPAEA